MGERKRIRDTKFEKGRKTILSKFRKALGIVSEDQVHHALP